MILGLTGSLLSHAVVEGLLADRGEVRLPAVNVNGLRRACRSWYSTVRDRLGPACGPRQLFDLLAEPHFRQLGYEILAVSRTPDTIDALLRARDRAVAVLVVGGWGTSANAQWAHAVRLALAHDVRWCIHLNGTAVRLFDAGRAYSRRHVEIDLLQAHEDERTFEALARLLHPLTLVHTEDPPVLEAVISACERHRSEVRTSLRDGVHQALLHLIGAFRAASRRHPDGVLLAESLTVVYRILFLLFAEARGLVPRWHPVYRDSYTVDALCRELPRRGAGAGVWQGLQAIARLAHRGCRAGTLRVPPFNGRLFSPADAPLADTLPLADEAVAAALVALTTRAGRGARERIAYGDLGVEQLGGVYEHLLDFDARTGAAGRRVLLVPTGRRKATGTFYTPRTLTDFIVRRTLAPLVAGAGSGDILKLRVLDPAMGSGAFLVSACRYIAAAYEQALLREGGCSEHDLDDRDRAGFRRMVAQRCLYGVDSNPVAVQLGRLSLWLATLAADKPLSFLDHHLRPGNSLVGATPLAMVRQPVPGLARLRRADLPLFEGAALESAMGHAVAARTSLAETPDDSLEQVRAKERTWASLNRPSAPLDRWRVAGNVWCAAWFGGVRRPWSAAAFRALLDGVLSNRSSLPPRAWAAIQEGAAALAASERFFHWPFEFPELFYDERGVPLREPGFDAVLGNPPWEMLRRDPGAADNAGLTAFVRGAGVYALQGRGHHNLYQLFLERAFHLLKPKGRCGVVLPSAIGTDRGCADLRRHLFTRTSIDTFTTIENRDGIFPIHRGLKFLLLTCSSGGTTSDLPAGAGLRSPEVLDAVPDTGRQEGTLLIPRALIEAVGGEDLAIPELRSREDVTICSSIALRVPCLGDPAGWHVRFGRELNATDDKHHFRIDGGGLPVVEGKHLCAFGVDTAACRHRITRAAAARLLNPGETFERARLAYREVASATNRMTLIAAVLPPGVVSTHTVFCLKDPLADTAQQYLCGMFNSYVANYLVRLRVGTHVTAAIISRLHVPRPAADDPRYQEVAASSQCLAAGADVRRLAGLNAAAAALYGLTPSQFAHVLRSFPLVPERERSLAFELFLKRRRPEAEG